MLRILLFFISMTTLPVFSVAEEPEDDHLAEEKLITGIDRPNLYDRTMEGIRRTRQRHRRSRRKHYRYCEPEDEDCPYDPRHQPKQQSNDETESINLEEE